MAPHAYRLDVDSEVVRLRRGAIIAGRILGWDTGHVVAFTEALTYRPWRRCGCAELGMVVAEFRALMDAIDARRARAAHRHGGGAG